MLYFLFGEKTKNNKKRLTFMIKPNELENLANSADAIKGLFDACIKKGKKLDLKDREVKTLYNAFDSLRKNIDSLAKKSV